MTRWQRLEHFLDTDPRDVGCDQAMAVLDIYAEIIVEGNDPDDLYPGITAHIRACGPCAEDLAGLLSAIRDTDPRV